MKDSNVLKKYLILCSILVSIGYTDDLGDILSDNKSILFDYEIKTNELESDKLSKSWVNPVILRYKKSYSTQFSDRSDIRDTVSVSIDQPIFRSGGIYYGIKYAQAQRNANTVEIKRQKRMMIGDAVSILFNLEKTKLEQEKLRYLIKNDTIDIRQKRDSYESGLLDSSFLDQAILKKSQDETNLLQLELNFIDLTKSFSLLSDKNPDILRLPHLSLMGQEQYTNKNLELQRDKHRAEQSAHNVHVTRAKYSPTVSLQGQYIDGDLNPHFFSPTLQERYYNYGFSVSMPLDINTFNDLEVSKVEKLKTALEVVEREETIKEEYTWIVKSLAILDKKINLAQKDEKVYNNLFNVTKNLVQAGEKTSLDSDIMYNSLQIRKIDQKIYKIDKQIQLLKLYVRMENAL